MKRIQSNVGVSGTVILALGLGGCVSSKHPELYKAVRRDNASKVSSLLSGGADPNAPDSDKIGGGLRARFPTALHAAAAWSRDPAIVLDLVASGARVNAVSGRDGKTPLHVAIEVGAPLEIVSALLLSGADVNAPIVEGYVGEDVGMTPLHLSVTSCRDSSVLLLLVEGGAYVDQRAYLLAERSCATDQQRIAQVLTESGVRRDERKLAQMLADERAANKDDNVGGFNWGKAAAIAGVAAVAVTAADAGVPAEDVVEMTGAAIADIVGETGGENVVRVAGNPGTGGAGPLGSATAGGATDSQPGTGLAAAAGGKCEIPGYAEGNPSAFDASTTRLSWCRNHTGIQDPDLGEYGGTDQLGYQALDAELHRCALSLGQVAPDKVASFAATLRQRCDDVATLAARGPHDCRCPRSYYELGR